MVDATGAPIATKGFLGFLNDQDDGDKFDTIYQAASQTLQTVEANVAICFERQNTSCRPFTWQYYPVVTWQAGMAE